MNTNLAFVHYKEEGGGYHHPLHINDINLFVPRNDRAKEVHWYWEDDGAVVLCRDAAQSLKVAQLTKRKPYFDIKVPYRFLDYL